MRLVTVLAAPLLLAALPSCSSEPPEAIAKRLVERRLAHDCEAMWRLLTRRAKAATPRTEYFSRCDDARESKLISAMFERTTLRVVATVETANGVDVEIETDAPDPTKAFTASFRSEVDELGKDVVDILGAGVRPDVGLEPTPPPPRDAPATPRLTDEEASDAWMAAEISRPDVRRMKKRHTVSLVRERWRWRVDHDPLDQ